MRVTTKKGTAQNSIGEKKQTLLNLKENLYNNNKNVKNRKQKINK
jgi:hypothetical protein